LLIKPHPPAPLSKGEGESPPLRGGV